MLHGHPSNAPRWFSFEAPTRRRVFLFFSCVVFFAAFGFSAARSAQAQNNIEHIFTQSAQGIPFAVQQHYTAQKNLPPAQASPAAKTLTVALPKQTVTFDFVNSISVIESTLYTALYSGLTVADPATLQPRPGLAVSWFVSEDQTVYTFNLRKNARFSDGSAVTAEDVKASWFASIQKQTPFTYLFYPIRGVTQFVEGTGALKDIGIAVLSDRVLQVTLEKPANYFLSSLTHSSFSVTSKFQMAARDWDADPTGIIFSGPYKIERVQNDAIIMTQNPYFWGRDMLSARTIVVRLYEESESKKILDAFASGEIQWLSPGNLAADADIASAVDPAMIYQFALFGTSYLFFKADEAPWTNPAVRRALSLLLPWDAFKERFIFPAESLVPKIAGYESGRAGPKQNVERAYELLAEAGFPEGAGLPPIVIFVAGASDESYPAVFDDIQTSLAGALKTSVRIELSTPGRYNNEIKDKRFVIGASNWIGDFGDPMAFLQMWTHKNEQVGHYYDSEEYRKLIAESSALQGPERIRALQKAEATLLDDAMVIPLYHLFSVELVRNDLVYGWYPNPLNVHSLPGMWFIPDVTIPYIIRAPGTTSEHFGPIAARIF